MSNYALSVLRKNRQSTFGLQITSMIDMFTIILVFLLKTYASSAITIAPGKDVRLPDSTAVQQPIEALKMVVARSGIYVDDKSVVTFDAAGNLPGTAVDKQDKKFIRPLYDALKAQADKTKSIAKENTNVQFEGKLIFQGDQALGYETMKKVMYTAAFAGYTDVKFAVISSQ
jgi:biopolymer transport protein ExbD